MAVTGNGSAGVRGTERGSVRSTEQISKSVYDALPAHKKTRAMNWRRLGNSWTNSILNSGVLAPDQPRRFANPSDAARQQLADELTEKRLAREVRHSLPDECSRRYQTAHHESAHGVVALSFNRALRFISISPDNPSSGLCEYARGATPLETATICIAPVVWLEQVYRDFPYYLPWGATGCEKDLQKAHDAVGWEINKAFTWARAILTDNRDAVIAIADQLDRDGEYRP
jgi:hypothetical protein